MFVEKRKAGKSTKYYLVHSYRDAQNRVKKIRRYLGSGLNKISLKKLKSRAQELILAQIETLDTQIFEFSLSPREIEQLNSYQPRIHHLNAKQWERFTEDFVYNTNAIEGSTIAEEEVSAILNKPRVYDPDEKETKGVAKALVFIRTTKHDISLSLLKKLHKLCFAGTKSYAGAFRSVEVVIRDARGRIVHRGVPVAELNTLLKEYIAWYQKHKQRFTPLALAAIMHNQFEHIHPFQDGNGRVGRLVLNLILIQNGYPPINIHLEDRAQYYKTLQHYSQTHDLKPTMKFLVQQYQKSLSEVTTKSKKPV